MSVARRFEDLIVGQLAVRIRDRVYALMETGAASRDFKFRDQIRDSASSVPSNISEGFLLYSPPQFARQLNIAKGSLGETQNHLLHGKEKKYFLGGRIHRPVAADVPRSQSRESSARLPAAVRSA